MARFTLIPPLYIGRKGQWLLADECIYHSDLVGRVCVPEGYETDLASIPRWALTIHPRNGLHRPAAIVHDYLCREGEVPRVLADKTFLEAMKVLGVAGWRRRQMYAAVRLLTFWLKLRGKAK